ncbi:YugN-like protein [Melghiribacillus thermohalophilus]|uniref:YugN-like protein n=1 Tax=Melghiribacillus thermohalophilus TaxID=1324956 RepID=A0A4R3NHY9_9BACI|nr:YugN family protein [Melghiribacillus thermohalophilus]TCT26902.1 YugN-like protein [Melghiribacillus thermohalophilus]
MRIEGTGLEDAVVELKALDHIMKSNGFVRASQWDYERVTYDFKIDTPAKNETIYVRVQGYATEGDVDSGDAVIKLITPLIGRHYYPHGVEYGEEEKFASNILDKAKKLLSRVKESVDRLKTE